MSIPTREVPSAPQPESVTVPADLYEQLINVLLSLPAGQVFNLLQALQQRAIPNLPAPDEADQEGATDGADSG